MKSDHYNHYIKTYPFEKSVFIEKFNTRTVPFYERVSRLKPLGRKLEGRVFVGKIRGKKFKVATIPDMLDAVRHPWPGIIKLPVWRNPSCVYGNIYEHDGHTTVDYTIEIMKAARVKSIHEIIAGSLFVIVFIIGMCVEGFQFRAFLGVVIFVLFIISAFSALQPHQSEHDALKKFMEGLEN